MEVQSRVGTVLGGVITVLIFCVVFAYASLKAIDMVEKRNPTINENTVLGGFSLSDVLDFNEIGIRFAFSVVNTKEDHDRFDSRYTKYLIRLYGRENGEKM